MERKINRKIFAIVFGTTVLLILMLAMHSTVHASQHRDPALFNHSYHFTSGMDYRFDLGRPTTFDGFVPVNVFTVNMRRDANVSLRPPGYGIFSGLIPTEPSNRLFPQPANPNFRFSELDNANVIPRYDTLQMGVNAPHLGNPLNMHNVGTPMSLPYATSMVNHDIVPHGANNMTGNWFENQNGVFSQSGNNSSMVTTQFPDGFLPPTSITSATSIEN